MSRELKLIDKPLHREMSVYANDEPGPGGANHLYAISTSNPDVPTTHLRFQKGAVNEVGVNGVSDEALLSILIDRLRGFQNGPFKSREGALILTKLEEAQHWQRARYEERVERGVEGYNKV